jgi:hypothetical protein
VLVRFALPKIDDTNSFFKLYVITAWLLGLAVPAGTKLLDPVTRITKHLPFASWLQNIHGVSPYLSNYFALMWLLLPAWLFAFSLVYARNYSSEHIPAGKLIVLSLFMLGLLVVLCFIPVDIRDHATWRDALVIIAAKNRLVGAFVFGSLMSMIFLFAALPLAKAPIDLVRLLKR